MQVLASAAGERAVGEPCAPNDVNYIVALEDSGQVIKAAAEQLSRDARFFSKAIIDRFLRQVVYRAHTPGSAWLAKPHLLARYDIQSPPPLGQQQDKGQRADAPSLPLAAAPDSAPADPADVAVQAAPPRPSRPTFTVRCKPEMRMGTWVALPALPQPPSSVSYDVVTNGTQTFHPGLPHVLHVQQMVPQSVYDQLPSQIIGPPIPFPHPQLQGQQQAVTQLPPMLNHIVVPTGTALPVNLPFQNNFMQYQTVEQAQVQVKPPPIKFPIEDLDVFPGSDAPQRPPLKFISDDVPARTEPPKEKKGISMKSIGPLLNVWDTLNVHDGIYNLDSFTLDDLIDAMRISSIEIDCNLFAEMHCSVIKQLVDTNGRLQIVFPEPSTDEEEESEESPSPEPVAEAPARRTTRSSLRTSGAEAVQPSPSPEPPQTHCAAQFLEDFDWVEQCKQRDFSNGKWQAIYVGLFHALLPSTIHHDLCEELLLELVPSHEEPTCDSIARQYVQMDFQLKVSALEMVTLLTVSTANFRDSLITASTHMTEYRRLKMDRQKERKTK